MRKPTVWIVDDDKAFGSLLEMIVSEYPTRVFTALDDLDAALARDLPEILLLDLMFGKDVHAGVRFLEDLRLRYPSVLVIVVSASKDQRDAHRTGQLQAFDFVEKGVPGQSFHEELLSVVGNAERHCTLNHVLSQLFGLTDLIRALTGRSVEKCDPVVRLVLQCFLANISEIGPSVTAISERVGIPTSTIREHFQKQFKTGPSQTLTDIALLIAGSLITGGFKVSEAAAIVGMGPERLRQQFHMAFECSPSRSHEVGVFHNISRENWLHNTPMASRHRAGEGRSQPERY